MTRTIKIFNDRFALIIKTAELSGLGMQTPNYGIMMKGCGFLKTRELLLIKRKDQTEQKI